MEDVLKPHGSLLATDRSKAVFGVGVSCRILFSFVVFYLYVSSSGSITSVWEALRELFFLQLLFTCNYTVSVRRGFLFLWVLGMGYGILLWHSLSLPYNYFESDQAPRLEHFFMLNSIEQEIQVAHKYQNSRSQWIF